METAGVKDVLTKSLGSANKTNVARATVAGLSQIKDPKAAAARRRAGTVTGEAING
ncbi:MAG: 30S ribosomal protein S5, partial [Dehalococcoidia bacterium]